MKYFTLILALIVLISGCSENENNDKRTALSYIKLNANGLIDIENTSTNRKIRATYWCETNKPKKGWGKTASISLEPGDYYFKIKDQGEKSDEYDPYCLHAKLRGARFIGND